MKNIVKTFQGLTSVQKVLVLIILATFLYGLSASLSYSIFSKVAFKGALPTGTSSSASLPTTTSIVSEDPAQPKTESCPLNGSMHTKTAKDS